MRYRCHAETAEITVEADDAETAQNIAYVLICRALKPRHIVAWDAAAVPKFGAEEEP